MALKISDMKTLTPELRKRTESALSETKALLAKEMGISEDLRYNDRVEFYKTHIKKLENILFNNSYDF